MRRINKQEPLEAFERFKKDNPGANWSDFHKIAPMTYQESRFQILTEEQYCLCGYTEIMLDDDTDCHLDHFIKKSLDATKTFDWNNLIAASNDDDFGARHKDMKYSIQLQEYSLIYYPVVDNPEHYFNYLQNGEIEPKDNLDSPDKEKVNKTVEVFNLNAPQLSKRRRDLIKQIRDTKNGGLSSELMFSAFSNRGFQSVKDQEI